MSSSNRTGQTKSSQVNLLCKNWRKPPSSPRRRTSLAYFLDFPFARCRQYGIFILQSVLSLLAQRSSLVSWSPPHAKRLSFSEYALALYRLRPGWHADPTVFTLEHIITNLELSTLMNLRLSLRIGRRWIFTAAPARLRKMAIHTKCPECPET